METNTRSNTLRELSEVVGNEEHNHYRGTLLIRVNGGIADVGVACMGVLQLQRSIKLSKSKISNAFKLFFGIRKILKDLPPELSSDIYNVLPQRQKRIAVVGIGGCGGNLVSYTEKHFPGACDYYACDTDTQALSTHNDVEKIMLNREDGELEQSETVLGTIMQKHPEIVIVSTGTTGKTGTSLAPQIANGFKERGIVTVTAATTSLRNEGIEAESLSNMSRLKECSDGLLRIDSNKLAEYYANAPLTAYFDGANEIFSYMTGCLSMTDNVKDFLKGCGAITVGTAYRPGDLDLTISEAISYSKRYGPSLDNSERLLVWVESDNPERYSTKEVQKIIDKQIQGIKWLKTFKTRGKQVGVRVTVVGTGNTGVSFLAKI